MASAVWAKSATAGALQTITAEPFLHVQMDAYLDMLPERMFGHPDGLVFDATEDRGCPSVSISSGRVVEHAMHGMRHAIAAMAALGNRLIVDDVLLESAREQQYRRLLSPFGVRLIGLFAPLELLEERELARGDRKVGVCAVAV